MNIPSVPVLVGEVLRAHGLRGEVVVRLHTENGDRFRPGSRLSMDNDQTVTVAAVRPHHDNLLVTFEGILDRNRADAMRGRLIFVDSSEVGPAEPEAFWEHELAGLEVVSIEGDVLGTIERVIPRAEQDLWEVRTPSGTVLFPAARDLVQKVDLEARKITVEAPAGLF